MNKRLNKHEKITEIRKIEKINFKYKHENRKKLKYTRNEIVEFFNNYKIKKNKHRIKIQTKNN